MIRRVFKCNFEDKEKVRGTNDEVQGKCTSQKKKEKVRGMSDEVQGKYTSQKKHAISIIASFSLVLSSSYFVPSLLFFHQLF